MSVADLAYYREQTTRLERYRILLLGYSKRVSLYPGWNPPRQPGVTPNNSREDRYEKVQKSLEAKGVDIMGLDITTISAVSIPDQSLERKKLRALRTALIEYGVRPE